MNLERVLEEKSVKAEVTEIGVNVANNLRAILDNMLSNYCYETERTRRAKDQFGHAIWMFELAMREDFIKDFGSEESQKI